MDRIYDNFKADEEALNIAEWMKDHKNDSIRDVARQFCMPKSTVYDRIERLKDLDYDSYDNIKYILGRRRIK